MWIEAGDMSGGSRNQIEFDRDLASFFTDSLPTIGEQTVLAVDAGKGSWTDSSLVAKETTFGVEIFRLNLPTVTKGGEDYAGRIVRFERKGRRYFKVSVFDQGSAEHNQLKQGSTSNGTISRTGGARGREFGFL